MAMVAMITVAAEKGRRGAKHSAAELQVLQNFVIERLIKVYFTTHLL